MRTAYHGVTMHAPKSLVLCSLLTLVPAAATAQKVCFEDNANIPLTVPTLVSSWFVTPFSPPTNETVSGLELKFSNTSPAGGSVQIGVFDSVGGMPGSQVSSGTIVAPSGPSIGWLSGALNPPVAMTAGSQWFIGLFQNPNLRQAHGTGGNPTTYYFLHASTQAWRGPYKRSSWPIRIYCGQHKGSYTNFGASTPALSGAASELTGGGWPNSGNPINLLLSNAPANIPGVMMVGTRANVVIPGLGTAYAFPPVISVPFATNDLGGGLGAYRLSLAVPSGLLVGGQFSMQGWLLESTLLSHTGGLQITLGI